MATSSLQGARRISKKGNACFYKKGNVHFYKSINKIAEKIGKKIGMVLTVGDNIRVLISGCRAHFQKRKCTLLQMKNSRKKIGKK